MLELESSVVVFAPEPGLGAGVVVLNIVKPSNLEAMASNLL